MKKKKRIPLKKASSIAYEILHQIKNIPEIKNAVVAGSIRRKKETIGDIDIVVCTESKNILKIIESIIQLPPIDKVLAKGKTKLSMIIKKENIQCDIRIVNENQFGSALLYFTGSKEHNIILRSIARNKGLKINEYGVFEVKTNNRLGGKTEEEIYELLDLKFVSPEERTGKNEFKSK